MYIFSFFVHLHNRETLLHNQPANLHNRDMCERAMGLRGRGQPTASQSGRDPLDTSSRDSENAGDKGRVEGAKRLSSPQPHSLLRKKKRGSFSQFLKFCRANVGQMSKRKSQPIKYQPVDFSKSAGEGTRTHTPEAPDPKSGLSTNFNTPAISNSCGKKRTGCISKHQ